MDGDAHDQNNNPRVWPPAKRAYVFYAKVTLLKANQIPDYLFRGMFRMWRTTYVLITCFYESSIFICNYFSEKKNVFLIKAAVIFAFPFNT